MPTRPPALVRLAPALTLIAALAARPTVGRAAGDGAPAVDLRHITLTDAGATAPVVGGGRAELTLDPGLQRAAARLLSQANPAAGAVVAIDARTGRVLAWAEHGAAHPGEVLLERQAPSASVFKVVTTAALLEHSPVSTSEKICYEGGLHTVELRHLRAPRGGEGVRCTHFGVALGHSINAVYAQLATRYLMRDDLVNTAARVGFNQSVPFDVPIRLGRIEIPYNDLAFARTATGFIDSTLSPLGATWLAYVVASGGAAVRPHIVRRAGDWEAPPEREVVGRVFQPRTARILRRMMEVTVNSGTSHEAFTDESQRSYLPGIQVAGKTGTLRPSPSSPTTSWFIGFAPSKSPRIVVGVLLENRRVWRRKANQVARDVLRVWFARDARYPRVTDPLAPAQ
ncbi:MAG: penicillin-binding transpeptidase domain-containing protein [Sorangiineae bacterium]|nr:penicillin-binding transpeptidase domain-containing protein [Polyangiaceae bacterium]MEB2323559.1 penicillin-binding transpeptidase domain-containing protein [Sorangiineae bacterium]